MDDTLTLLENDPEAMAGYLYLRELHLQGQHDQSSHGNEEGKQEEKSFKEFNHNRKGDSAIWGKEQFNKADISLSERESLSNYKNDSIPINDYARFGRAGTSTKRDMDNIDLAISKSDIPEDIKVFRGLDILSVSNKGFDAESLVGIEFTDKGFVSTTMHERGALGWAFNYASIDNEKWSGAIVQVNLPKGSKGLYLDSPLVADKGEYEILLPRNLKFKIVKDEAVSRFGVDLPYRKLTAEIVNE